MVGFSLTSGQLAISTWPLNAVLLALLLLVPRRLWLIVIAAALPAHLLIEVHHGMPFTTAMGWFMRNTGEALLGAYLVSLACQVEQLFTQVRALMVFLLVGVLGAPLVTSFLDAVVVSATGSGHNYWLTWITLLFSSMFAVLTIVPVVVTFCLEGKSWIGRASIKRCVEGSALLACIVLVTTFAAPLGMSQTSKIQSVFLTFPFLLWATLRYGVGGLSSCLLVISVIVSREAAHQQMSSQLSSLPDIIYVQGSLGLLSLPFMFLGVLLAQDSRTHESLRESKARLIDNQEQERRRIARELHDGIGQSLALLQLDLALLEPECAPEARTRLQSIGKQVTEVSSVAREISHGLHPSHLAYVGLRGALKELCSECGRDMSLNIDFQSRIPESLAPEVSLTLYRVTQEALHNISKYSHARNVGVRLRMMENDLVLEVQDDGVGFSVDHRTSSGIGISNMHERIESVGGRISIKSARMQGTKITASVPLNTLLQKAA
jgi:two-component system sensor histidine kinase UhpB